MGGADIAMLPYTLAGANTPITYMNFEIKKSSIKKIENLLPSNLKLVKTSMREDQKANYMMTARISEGGIGVIVAEPQYYGLVVDLIVYVECESNPNEIYQMVLETKSNFDCNLTNKLNAPAVSSFSYTLVGNKIRTVIDDSTFSLMDISHSAKLKMKMWSLLVLIKNGLYPTVVNMLLMVLTITIFVIISYTV